MTRLVKLDELPLDEELLSSDKQHHQCRLETIAETWFTVSENWKYKCNKGCVHESRDELS